MFQNVRTGILSGGLLLCVGMFFTIGALQIEIGTARSMGPGFFPLCLGGLLLGLSALTFVVDWRQHTRLGAPSRSIVFIGLAIAAFALLIKPFGLIPAVAVAVFVAAIADEEWRWLPTAVLSLVSGAALWVVFVKLLGLPIAGLKVLGSWIF